MTRPLSELDALHAEHHALSVAMHALPSGSASATPTTNGPQTAILPKPKRPPSEPHNAASPTPQTPTDRRSTTVNTPQFTERQAAAWPDAVAEAQRHVTSSTIRPDLHYWTAEWAEEVRPGRGHAFNGIWTDGEFFVQVLMDVYGYPSVSVAELDLVHNSTVDECPCEPCTDDRDVEAAS